MSKIALSGNASGTGTLTIAAPNTNSNYTLTLPAETGTVTTSGSTPTFTGAVTAPGFIPNSSTVVTDGLYLPAASTVALSTGTTERMRINSSGNVGIGGAPTVFGTGYTTVQIQGKSTYGAALRFVADGDTPDTNDGVIYHTGSAFYIRSNGTDPTIFYNNGDERARITSGGDLWFNSGYGSVATAYGCRAWVNFNGTGTVAIRANGNVSSITDNGTGDYTVNYTNAFPDANYALNAIARGSGSSDSSANNVCIGSATAPSTSATRIVVRNDAGSAVDVDTIAVTVHR